MIRVLVVVLALFAPAPAVASDFVRQTRDVPGTLDAIALRDVDRDGVQDLVFTAIDAEVRRVGFFRGRRVGGFDERPAWTLDLKPDVVMVAVGDVDPAPGAEFILFTGRSVFAVRWGESDASKRFRRLVREEMFFASPPRRRAPLWPDVRDVDGDGLDDLCIPTAEGLVLRRQRRTEDVSDFAERVRLAMRVHHWSEDANRRGRRMTFRFGGDGSSPQGGDEPPIAGVLVDATRQMAAPRFVDANGDGRLDVVLLEGKTVAEWHQREGGGFAAAPTVRRAGEQLRPSTPRWSGVGHVFAHDVDGDGKLDFLVRDESPQDLRTRLVLYAGSGDLARPSVVLMLSGLTATPRFRDVDGDGRVDLLIPTYRLDLLRGATSSASSLDVTLHVFLGQASGPPFGREPDYSHDLRVRTDALAVSGIEPMIYLDGDFNRDGRADLLVVDERRRLRVHLATETTGGLLASGGTFAFRDAPAVDVEVDVPNRIRLIDVEGDGQHEILLVYPRRFVLAGWGIRERVGR